MYVMLAGQGEGCGESNVSRKIMRLVEIHQDYELLICCHD